MYTVDYFHGIFLDFEAKNTRSNFTSKVTEKHHKYISPILTFCFHVDLHSQSDLHEIATSTYSRNKPKRLSPTNLEFLNTFEVALLDLRDYLLIKWQVVNLS